MQITTIGLDLAKHWFQVHGVDTNGQVVVRRRLWRSEVIAYFRSLEPCLVGMEACATAHHWACELIALGHTVKLMPPGLREGLRQAQQERCGRCGSNLRGSNAALDAVRAGEGR
jgi:transposase